MFKPSVLPMDERDRRWREVREEMGKRGLGSLIVWGSFGFFSHFNANLRYISNVKTEGYLVFPLEAEPTLFTFIRKPEVVWVKDWQTGHPKYSRAISARLKELHLDRSRIGLVGLSGYFGEMGFPHTTYMSLVDDLPQARIEDATDIVEKMRRIKSDAEIGCLEAACEMADDVFKVIKETAQIGVKDYEVRAKIMDTVFRNGSEPDCMLLYCSGKEMIHAAQGGYLQPPVARKLEAGDILLTEFDTKYLGYGAQHNQPFSIGKPDREWSDIFKVAVESFDNAFKALRPGITAGELDEAFLSPIRNHGYVHHNPCFHGLGLGLEEPIGSLPAQTGHKPDTSLIIQAGMVLELEPHVVSQYKRMGLSFGCPVLVTDSGCRLLNESWRPEFRVVGSK